MTLLHFFGRTVVFLVTTTIFGTLGLILIFLFFILLFLIIVVIFLERTILLFAGAVRFLFQSSVMLLCGLIRRTARLFGFVGHGLCEDHQHHEDAQQQDPAPHALTGTAIY